MKVVFVFGTLAHYVVQILNRLNSIDNYEVIAIIPHQKSVSVGEGVYQTQIGARFKVIRLNEYQTYYHKPFFSDLIKTLNQENPKIIIAGWPYILGLIFNPKIFFYLKLKKIKIILRDIPFQLPNFNETIEFYKNNGLFIEDEGFIEVKIKSSDLFKYKLLAYIRKIYFNLTDAHVYYTENAYDILKSYAVKKEKIFTIYNSPDTDELLTIFDEVKLEKPILPLNNFRLIHIGRLVKWKKVDLLIDAFKFIKEKYNEAELLIIGKGPEKGNLEKQATELNLKDSVKFLGAIYEPRVIGKYLHESKIYILAGMGGLSINEAMCFGKPVICSVCDGTEKKLVYDEINGKYFKLNDRDDLLNKIDYLFSNPELIKKMGENSIKIIREQININTVIKGYLKAFAYVMNE